MNPRKIFVLLILPALWINATYAQQFASNSEEETVPGWYHSHDINTWVTKGADRAVIEVIIERISQSEGEKRISDLVDTQIEFGPGNWAYEWIQAGDQALAEAGQLSGGNQAAETPGCTGLLHHGLLASSRQRG